MNIRQNFIDWEETYLCKDATKSNKSRGRQRQEDPCSIRTEFQRDRDRILHNKAFRRLKHKTQVFISPAKDHYRTRITHTLEVSQIARTIARALRLNEDLTEAIALGHDLGHTPFGHTGEEVLNKLLAGGFRHNEQSVRIVSVLDDLNLCAETIDGILNHTGLVNPFTLEGQIVKIADRVAYLNHDIDDGIRAGLIFEKDLPVQTLLLFGKTKSERITRMVKDIIYNSIGKDEVKMSEPFNIALLELRSWMFEKVYIGSSAKIEEHKAKKVITELFSYFIKNPDEISYKTKNIEDSKERMVADYIAGMTDRFAIQTYLEKFVPTSWNVGFSQSIL